MSFLRNLFAASRYVVALAVLATFVGSVVLLVDGALSVFRIAWLELYEFEVDELTAHHIDHLGVEFIKITDIILLGTVLYIISVGLYQLFIQKDLPLPQWLRVGDLADLKRDLISVTVVLLGVTFLGEAVDWSGSASILPLGAGVALVILALGFILWLTPRHGETEDPDES
jgi:uncharacterized membrane protein YqhA